MSEELYGEHVNLFFREVWYVLNASGQIIYYVVLDKREDGTYTWTTYDDGKRMHMKEHTGYEMWWTYDKDSRDAIGGHDSNGETWFY